MNRSPFAGPFDWVVVVWLCASVDLEFGWGWVGSGREVLGLVGRWLGAS
ncbi:hypothetical protein [Corynebacterium freiburgense]|nr:hypothetical protein [Corynebacterium freiburgense]